MAPTRPRERFFHQSGRGLTFSFTDTRSAMLLLVVGRQRHGLPATRVRTLGQPAGFCNSCASPGVLARCWRHRRARTLDLSMTFRFILQICANCNRCRRPKRAQKTLPVKRRRVGGQRGARVSLLPDALSTAALTRRFSVPSPEPPKTKAVAAAPTDGIAAAIAPTRGLRSPLSISAPRAPRLWVPESSSPAYCWRTYVCGQRRVCGVWWATTCVMRKKKKNSHVWPFRRLSHSSNQQCARAE